MADETSSQDSDIQDEASPEAIAETSEDSPEPSTDDSSPPESTNTETESASDTEADVSQETAPESESEPDDTEESEETSHRVTVEELLKAGAHFGHLTSRWNPRMEEYIFMERNNIHIIDLMQTQVLLDEAADAAKRFAKRGKKILFAGTKTQAQEIVREHAEECEMPHMVDRWLGGTMTNFQTIRKSIRRMEEIERMNRDGTLDKLKKKEKLMRLREHEKLEDTLGGIRISFSFFFSLSSVPSRSMRSISSMRRIDFRIV